MRLLLLVPLVLLAIATPAAQAQPDRSAASDRDPQGAVLCAWHVHVSLRITGEFCFPDREGFNALLDETIGRLDHFIIENSPTSQAEPDAAKETMRNEQRAWSGTAGSGSRQSICRAGPLVDSAVAMYRHLEGQGAERLRASTDRLLATPPPAGMESLLVTAPRRRAIRPRLDPSAARRLEPARDPGGRTPRP
jgi:hypothetical protein